MTETRKLDRRIVRTRHALRDALMGLIVEKGYESITIQDIADRADVNRATFYLHYKDKDDLLYKSMESVYNELVEHEHIFDLDAIQRGDFESMKVTSDWDHLAAHKAFYRVLLSERGSASFIVKVRRYLATLMRDEILRCFIPPGAKTRIPLEIIAYACAGAQIGVMSWWLENDSPYTPKEMADMLFDTLTFGITNALSEK
ncbi:MAG: TetR/AcrR family transcriptional regulator [Chloroflexota bacterium]|nr:TetR/AcrR family transcriptional regulator [Chloroflexota bacterium]